MRLDDMNKKLSYAFAMAGLTCVLSLPVMAASSTPAPSDTHKSKAMQTHDKSASSSKKAAGTNGAKTQGTALPGSGGEAGSGGNSSPGNKTPSGAGSTDE
jgi:uncharacterized membrane protein YgcG